MTSLTAKTSWSGGFSSSNPFTVYWPSGYDKKKVPSYNSNPPIGLYLDPETGNIIFIPTDCNETTIACIKVIEWRKDSTGKYIRIGEVRRDMQFIIKTCPNNNPPILTSTNKYSVCGGSQLCFL